MFPFYFYSLFRFTVLHGFFDGLGWKIFRVSWLVFLFRQLETVLLLVENQIKSLCCDQNTVFYLLKILF